MSMEIAYICAWLAGGKGKTREKIYFRYYIYIQWRGE